MRRSRHPSDAEPLPRREQALGGEESELGLLGQSVEMAPLELCEGGEGGLSEEVVESARRSGRVRRL